MPSRYPTFIVDAFTSKTFGGNQAAVCLIPKKRESFKCQKIAAEFNFSETAFPVPIDGDFATASRFHLRWFTPAVEAPICGHATLATAHVLFEHAGNKSEELRFDTLSGEMRVKRTAEGLLSLNFPRFTLQAIKSDLVNENRAMSKFPEATEVPDFVEKIIRRVVPTEIKIEALAYAAEPKSVIIAIDGATSKSAFEEIKFSFPELHAFDSKGDFVNQVIVTLHPLDAAAQGFLDENGEAYDFSLRFFAPWLGVNEDPATGSAQCGIAPFWSALLNKKSVYGEITQFSINFAAYQAFPGRGAQLRVSLDVPDRVVISGKGVTVVAGEIFLHDD